MHRDAQPPSLVLGTRSHLALAPRLLVLEGWRLRNVYDGAAVIQGDL